MRCGPNSEKRKKPRSNSCWRITKKRTIPEDHLTWRLLGEKGESTNSRPNGWRSPAREALARDWLIRTAPPTSDKTHKLKKKKKRRGSTAGTGGELTKERKSQKRRGQLPSPERGTWPLLAGKHKHPYQERGFRSQRSPMSKARFKKIMEIA